MKHADPSVFFSGTNHGFQALVYRSYTCWWTKSAVTTTCTRASAKLRARYVALSVHIHVTELCCSQYVYPSALCSWTSTWWLRIFRNPKIAERWWCLGIPPPVRWGSTRVFFRISPASGESSKQSPPNSDTQATLKADWKYNYGNKKWRSIDISIERSK